VLLHEGDGAGNQRAGGERRLGNAVSSLPSELPLGSTGQLPLGR
jgi:hypothetical protein